ncbi:MFS transporter [Methylobacterium nonmethylotrophicum]|uniref:MFS transporter n=1 Tax=Methylobacterium nonmethylotrophicum TaxID=1141884 RepID=A0A4Z0NGW2_9HYPH|nr:MFS transporter [Methylobacterium nonmethylotrophicum]TGD94788.1 MFS transporter [Methylobacterium nonmethylotrophicum]
MTRTGPAADIGEILDTGPWTAVQKTAALLAALSIVMDGFDGQLIGFAIPVLIREWGITRGDFAPALAAGLVGMGIGSACAGLFADRFGRRWAVIGSVLLFGLSTCAIGLSGNLWEIGILRFVAGLGIGGALPSATTMTAEFTPARRRTLAITATIVCVPLGGMLAGLFAGHVLPAFGWRALFFLGGLLPVVLGLVLIVALPESPRYLVRRPGRWPELVRLLGRMARPTPAGTAFTDAREQRVETREGVAALFERGRARDTLALWFAFFLNLLAVYSAFSWLPTMLVAEGLDVGVAGSGLTAYNLGGVFGALLCAVAITRLGSRGPLLACCIGGAATAFALMAVDIRQATGLLIAGFALQGFFANATQSTMYAVCAHVYPTAVRATGTAAALAFGRLGAILSAFAGAAIITAGGAAGYLVMLGLAMAGVAVALAVVGRHIPAAPRASDAVGARSAVAGS